MADLPNDPPATEGALPPAPRALSRPPRSGSAGTGLAVLLGLAALGGAGYAIWLARQGEAEGDARLIALRGDLDRQNGTLATLTRDLSNANATARELERKLADASETNRSMREELLGLGERATLLEDALASLAENSLGGATALKLNEAEFLLHMGSERLALFRDVPATLAAFRLADSQLADLDDPLLAGVRQTLATEIAALAEVPTTDADVTIGRIDALADRVATLPTRVTPVLADAAGPDAGIGGKLAHALSQLVRIRRVESDGTAGFVNPLQADAARAAVVLELELAKAALAARAIERAGGAFERARRQVAAGFAGDDAAVQAALAELAALHGESKPHPLPEVGRALAELSNLRTTQAIGATRDGDPDEPTRAGRAARTPPETPSPDGATDDDASAGDRDATPADAAANPPRTPAEAPPHARSTDAPVDA